MPLHRKLLLLGGGHSHLAVLGAAQHWPSGCRVMLVSPDAATAYSGMVPGVIAGHYAAADCLIDVERLSRAVGVRFVNASAISLDPQARTVTLDTGDTLGYDILSIDVGATPHTEPGMAQALHDGGCGQMILVPAKPFPLLMDRLGGFLKSIESASSPAACDMVVVGAGIAGIELALALAHRLGVPAAGERTPARIRLVAEGARVAQGSAPAVCTALERACAAAGVEVVPNTRVVGAQPPGELVTASGHRIAADLALFATGASAPAWLANSGLALDPRGFISVDATLASGSHPEVFAAGDCASVDAHPRPKAGVYAVRQGPPLAVNLRRALAGEAPLPFTPQRQALALVALGPRTAIAARNGLAVGGPASAPWLGRTLAEWTATWLWAWKDRIDRGFVARYRR